MKDDTLSTCKKDLIEVLSQHKCSIVSENVINVTRYNTDTREFLQEELFSPSEKIRETLQQCKSEIIKILDKYECYITHKDEVILDNEDTYLETYSSEASAFPEEFIPFGRID